MNNRKSICAILFFVLSIGLFFSCRDNNKPIEKDVVNKPEKLQEHLIDDLKKILEFAEGHKGSINDSVRLNYLVLDSIFYDSKDYQAIWSDKGKMTALGDSLFRFIKDAKEYGLFPQDYHYNAIAFIRRALVDSFARKNAILWTRADLLLTDAYFSLVKDLKQGRLKYDSVTLRTDSTLKDSFFIQNLNTAFRIDNIDSALHLLEPRYPGYDSLKLYTKDFLKTAKFKPFTYLYYPYKDSVQFFKTLQKRFHELGMVKSDSTQMDTLTMANVIRKYQKDKNFRVTGRVSEPLVDKLNNTDLEKFKRIAITLDRYKLLPDSLPQTYIWVNLPSFYLSAINNDTLVFESKIIVGAPTTRTPLLTSDITNFITLPQWTVPTSIIFKEMLPKIQQNINFLKKENLMVVDKDDDIVDPTKVNWKKLNRNHFPYQLKQQEGDNNSLGVIKFNFRNKYSVYLHDTNVRWMFGKAFRAISHGCVRVKEWGKLSDFLTRNDTVRYNPDTVRAWIKRQEKHTISGFKRVPIFIRYFGCEGKDGHVRFYDDIYEEDKFLREKYFAGKSVNE
jgi:L,D-transpeptidase YcbB